LAAGSQAIGSVTLGTGANTVGNVGIVAGSASMGTVGLNAGTNTVGKVDLLGNAGAAMDVAQAGGTAAANALQVAGVYDSTPPTLTNGQGAALLLDSGGRAVVAPAPYQYTPLASGMYGSSATSLTVPTGATYATVCALGAQVNYTTDGVHAATTSLGQQLGAGTCVSFSGAGVLSSLSIAVTSGATFNAEFFK
ncbi:MAG TPA: hypothetical protein VEH77_06410, partial [Roseiarcus sp.]|nr:hypothetical protein [Roseiarcus sp.]